MTEIKWKKGTVVSIETRENIFYLAQLMESPYLYIFDTCNSSHDWNVRSLEHIKALFCVGVVGQFLKASNIKKLDIPPKKSLEFPSYWIKKDHTARMYTIWEGTRDEMTFAMSELGGSLIQRDMKTNPQDYTHIKAINSNDNDVIDNHETMALRSYPEFNERLYLCHLLGEKVDPLKDLIFQRPMIDEYKVYMQIFIGRGSEHYK